MMDLAYLSSFGAQSLKDDTNVYHQETTPSPRIASGHLQAADAETRRDTFRALMGLLGTVATLTATDTNGDTQTADAECSDIQTSFLPEAFETGYRHPMTLIFEMIDAEFS